MYQVRKVKVSLKSYYDFESQNLLNKFSCEKYQNCNSKFRLLTLHNSHGISCSGITVLLYSLKNKN
jgi:hypothetical protein